MSDVSRPSISLVFRLDDDGKADALVKGILATEEQTITIDPDDPDWQRAARLKPWVDDDGNGFLYISPICGWRVSDDPFAFESIPDFPFRS